MTPEEIRAEAIDRLGRWQFERDEPGPGDRYEDWAPQYRREMTKFVDALGDMLPTGTETRVHPCDCQPCPECESAALDQGSTRQQRYVTGWQEISG